ncbi:MAG: hypothetical protein QME66_05075 [Candidatus Eisenbacteria bacterium]|nr:hypothetical protein [Candidatus Eisenbacteria bacterium]
MEPLKNLEKLRPDVAKVVEPYLRDFLAIERDAIESAFIFGSATGPDFVPGHSNVNIALLVKEISPAFLRKCLKLVESGFKKRIVAPVFLTPSYVATSLDVFPIEFLDMRETSLLVYGEDPFAGVELSNQSLRLECEQQLKGALLRVRQAYLEIGLAKRGLEKVLEQSLNSLIPIFRAMLVLKDMKPPRRKAEIVSSVSEAFGIRSGILTTILDMKLGRKRVPQGEEEKLLSEYLVCIEELASFADTLRTREKP